MNKFKTDEFLGKTVKNIKMFCSIGTEPIKDMFLLRFAAGGNKFSQLCGFLFDSANESTEYPRFAVAFVCKLRSKKYKRNGSNSLRSVFNTTDSQWFLFRRISNQRVDVLDKNAMLVNYGFDIDKFFDSDLFNAAIPKFQQTLNKGIKDCIEFADTLKDVEKSEANKFIAAIQDSIQFIKNHDVNNKFYTLNDLDAVDAEIAKIAKTPEQRKKELDAKTAAIHQDALNRMAGAKKYSDKAAKNDYIYQKLHGEDEVNEATEKEQYVKLVSSTDRSYLKFKFNVDKIDKDKALVIQNELKSLISDNIKDKDEIIFDVENIKFMSLKMVNVLLSIKKEAAGKIDITLEGLKKNKDLLTMFEMTGLADIFIIESEDDNLKVNEDYEQPIDILFSSRKPLTVKMLKDKLNRFKDIDVINVCLPNGEPGNTIVQMWNATAEFDAIDNDPQYKPDMRENVCHMRIMPSKVNESKTDEDDVVAEASRWDCEVTKEEEDGEEVWKIYEKNDHIWVATFHDEAAANAFAKTYPKMKEDYLKQAREAETKEEMVEKEEPSVEEVAEKELDDKIEEAMKEIYK